MCAVMRLVPGLKSLPSGRAGYLHSANLRPVMHNACKLKQQSCDALVAGHCHAAVQVGTRNDSGHVCSFAGAV